MNLKSKYSFFLYFLFICWTSSAQSQEEVSTEIKDSAPITTNKNWWGIQVGGNFFPSYTLEQDFVRESVSTNHYGYDDYNYLDSYSARFYLRAFQERAFSNERWSACIGINYSYLETSLGSQWAEDSEAMYVRINQNETAAEYIRVRHIQESIHAAGINLNLRYYFTLLNSFKFYISPGVAFNYNIKDNLSAGFINSDMVKYENDVTSMVGSPKQFHTAMMLTGGLELLSTEKIKLNLSCDAPYIMLSDKVSQLAEIRGGGGIGINLQFKL